MDEPLPVTSAHELEPLQRFGLNRRTEALSPGDAILPARLLKLMKAPDPEPRMDLRHLLRSEARDAQHLEHGSGSICAQPFERAGCAASGELFDGCGDGRPHSRYFAQAALADHLAERHREC
jgi:hypothetical protein